MSTPSVQSNLPATFPAVQQLRRFYEAGLAGALEQPRPIVGVTSNTVPAELLCATGYFPVVLRPERGGTSHADPYMEDVFDLRIRRIFDRLLSGEWGVLRAVIVPRTSEQEHKLFLYLREVARMEPERALPELILYNLLHARSDNARAYGLERTRELLKTLGSASPEQLRAAIQEGNAARNGVRSLLRLRADRLHGSEALPLIGAFHFMDRSLYARLAVEAAAELSAREPIHGPRILIKGAPLDHPHLHRAIEAHGAVVAAEDDWWGARAAGNDIPATDDPVEAIFEKYYADSPSPRVYPPAVADEWFLTAVTEVSGVVFYLPPEDDVLGWDYPRWRREMDERGIPHLLIREDASCGYVSAECQDRLENFVAELER